MYNYFMNMNDLNAQQIVLLCILVSFVSSIATGITTVSLLQQAPEPFTQTINRVVEKTIERVVTEPGETEVRTEKVVETVVVQAEDLTIDSVKNNSQSIARIYTDLPGTENDAFVGIGVIINDKGRIVTDSSISGLNYKAVYPNGEFKLKKVVEGSELISVYEPEDIGGTTFSIATMKNSFTLQLGQSIILLSGRKVDAVSTGIAEQFIDAIEPKEGESKVGKILTSIDPSKVLPGSIILNLSGEIVGFSFGPDAGTSVFIPSERVSSFIGTL